jgi:hypothetical protein
MTNTNDQNDHNEEMPFESKVPNLSHQQVLDVVMLRE